jgi:phosphopantothenoylcysteine decarboxylase/phosphopantothenate--cysteine ligase
VSMFNHAVVKENLQKLEKLGVQIVSPRLEENKAKMATSEEVTLAVLRRLGRGDLRSKRVLVIAGSTREAIDDVRCITNYSTGKTGIELAIAAWTRGAEVELWYGASPESPPCFFPCKRFDDLESLNTLITASALGFDAIIVPAAISDYTVEKAQGKLGSDRDIVLQLRPAPKALRTLRRRFKGMLVGFKLESRVSKEELEKRAREMMEASDADLAVANDVADVSEDKTEVLIIPRKGPVSRFCGGKTEASDAILDEVVTLL